MGLGPRGLNAGRSGPGGPNNRTGHSSLCTRGQDAHTFQDSADRGYADAGLGGDLRLITGKDAGMCFHREGMRLADTGNLVEAESAYQNAVRVWKDLGPSSMRTGPRRSLKLRVPSR